MSISYRILSVITIAYIVIFYFYPHLDIVVSSYFYDEMSGEFAFRDSFASQFIYKMTKILAFLVFFVSGGCYFYDIFIRHLPFLKFFDPIRRFIKLDKAQALFVFSVILAIPFLGLHFILKPLWGRARPYQLEEFGGDLQFSNIFELSPSLELNSFPSGHSSMAFSMLAICYIVPLIYRKLVLCVVSIWAIAGAFNRVVMGGHYLSDIIASAIITIFGIWILKAKILR